MKAIRILFALVFLSAAPAMAQIRGDYMEFRTADVYTGPCFANGEVNLTGNEAVLAWHVEKGVWAGQTLDGLNVVAVVRANATLGDPFTSPLPAKAVLIVDAGATPAQRAALVSFAQAQTAGLLSDVVAVETSPIRFEVNVGGRHGYATLEAANLTSLSTRAISSSDLLCHNEEVYYPPLAANLTHAMPAVATRSSYQGNHLGVRWSDAGRRSSFVGTFAQ